MAYWKHSIIKLTKIQAQKVEYAPAVMVSQYLLEEWTRLQ